MQFVTRISAHLNKRQQKLSVIFVVFLIAFVGTYLISLSHADSVYVNKEAESGSLTGSANVVNDSTASGGYAVQFGGNQTGPSVAPATPAATNAVVCGDSSVLDGPSAAPTPPAGDNIVTLPAGYNGNVNLQQPNTEYYFASGTHYISASAASESAYTQIDPGNNSLYIGAPGAILDGDGMNGTAFGQSYPNVATNVTIEHLTIDDFGETGTHGTSTVNHSGAPYWTMEYNTIGPNGNTQGSNGGYGVGVGSYDLLEHNCITGNSEGGFNGATASDAWTVSAAVGVSDGPINAVISSNEISDNGLGLFPDTNCGCAAGGKIFGSLNATITNNYVHDNYGVGIWPDFDNAGANISGNYIASNWGYGVMYEASYNAQINDNTLAGNGWASNPNSESEPGGAWPAGKIGNVSDTNGKGPIDGQTGNIYGAIYLPNTGGDSNIASNYSGNLNVENNVFKNNFGGISVYQDSNRFCGPNPSDQGNCTINSPATYYNPASPSVADGGCSQDDLVGGSENAASGSPSANYYDNCQWASKNVLVKGNTFQIDPSKITGCVASSNCGYTGIFSYSGSNYNYETGNQWSNPYAGFAIPYQMVSSYANNKFEDNSYCGPWSFWYANQGNQVSQAFWQQTTGTDTNSGQNWPATGQDAGSTFSASCE